MHRPEKVSIKGWIYLTCFVILIASGIIAKRVYHHPEFMPLFHLPAAVFLVLSGYELTKKSRERYAQLVTQWRQDESNRI